MSGQQRGMALLLVLWACTVLAILLGSYAGMARLQALQARHVLAETRAHYAAETALVETIYQLLQGPEVAPRIRTDGAPRSLMLEGIKLRISVWDERGKIDLNQAPVEVLRPWLDQAGAADPDALAAAIVVWRHPRMQHPDPGLAGTESSRHGGPFTSLEELGRVAGMTPRLLQVLLPDATLWSGETLPAPELASAAVLAAIRRLAPGAAERAFQARIHHPVDDASPQPYGAVQSIRVEADAAAGGQARLMATVRLQPWSTDRAYTVLRWQEDGRR